VAVYAEDKEGLLAQPKMIQFVVGNLLYLPIVRQ